MTQHLAPSIALLAALMPAMAHAQTVTPPTPREVQSLAQYGASLQALIDAADSQPAAAALIRQRNALQAQLDTVNKQLSNVPTVATTIAQQQHIATLFARHNALQTQLATLNKQINTAEGPAVVWAREVLQMLPPCDVCAIPNAAPTPPPAIPIGAVKLKALALALFACTLGMGQVKHGQR